MSSGLHQRGAGGRQARRILRQEIRKGLRKLDGGRRATDEDIHDARKRIRKARAALRLLRKAMSRAEYQREDRLLRDAARPLGAARDAKILVEALEGLRQRYAVARRVRGGERFRRTLLQARGEARRHALTGASGVRKSRKLMRKAKYLYLQLDLLAPICTPSVARLGLQLHCLSDDLGEDHDLAMLHDRVAAHMRDFPDEINARPLLRAIERSRSSLQARALLRGARLYSKRPAQLARTLGL